MFALHVYTAISPGFPGYATLGRQSDAVSAEISSRARTYVGPATFARPGGSVYSPAMTRSFDVLVIGGGAAGVAAALASAGRGARVGLVRTGPGVSAMAAGGWNGPLPEPLASALAAAGLPHRAGPVRVPHPVGDVRVFDHAPAAHADATPEEGALVCGIDGLAGHSPPALATLWADAAGVALEAAVARAGDTPRAGWSPVALAHALDREPGPLAESVAAAAARAGARRVILPAVLGIARPEEVRAALRDAAGVPVGEALGVPPSVPGWRLDRALLAILDRAGVTTLSGQVTGRTTENGRIRSVMVPGAGGDASEVEAGAFVLAAGKFTGGGIVADTDGAREPALGCPVRLEYPGGDGRDVDPIALTHADRTLPQPLLRAGVARDERARPVDGTGRVAYHNVYVAGSIVAGVETAGLGLGHAAADGWRAGELAAEAAA